MVLLPDASGTNIRMFLRILKTDNVSQLWPHLIKLETDLTGAKNKVFEHENIPSVLIKAR